MEKAKFWIDWLFEAGGDDCICHRYWVELELSEQEYEELYQVWFDNGCELNSWYSEWKGHYELFDKIDGASYHALNELLKKHEPEFANPIEALWEISKETADAF